MNEKGNASLSGNRSNGGSNGSGNTGKRDSSGGNGGQRGNGESVKHRDIVGVVERNEVSYWTKIGVAFENRDGSLTLLFDYMPIKPEMRIQVRDPRPKEPESERRAQR